MFNLSAGSVQFGLGGIPFNDVVLPKVIVNIRRITVCDVKPDGCLLAGKTRAPSGNNRAITDPDFGGVFLGLFILREAKTQSDDYIVPADDVFRIIRRIRFVDFLYLIKARHGGKLA
jgi:hypothetical protein